MAKAPAELCIPHFLTALTQKRVAGWRHDRPRQPHACRAHQPGFKGSLISLAADTRREQGGTSPAAASHSPLESSSVSSLSASSNGWDIPTQQQSSLDAFSSSLLLSFSLTTSRPWWSCPGWDVHWGGSQQPSHRE